MSITVMRLSLVPTLTAMRTYGTHMTPTPRKMPRMSTIQKASRPSTRSTHYLPTVHLTHFFSHSPPRATLLQALPLQLTPPLHPTHMKCMLHQMPAHQTCYTYACPPRHNHFITSQHSAPRGGRPYDGDVSTLRELHQPAVGVLCCCSARRFCAPGSGTALVAPREAHRASFCDGLAHR